MTFGHQHFGGLDLGDARRNRRLPELVREAIAEATQSGATVLILHDRTELDFTSKTTLFDHLGQIGEGIPFIEPDSIAPRVMEFFSLGFLRGGRCGIWRAFRVGCEVQFEQFLWSIPKLGCLIPANRRPS